MNKIFKSLFYICTLFNINLMHSACNPCLVGTSASNDNSDNNFSQIRTAVHYRSQGANTPRELVGWQWDINRPYMCEYYGSAYLAFEYQHSFRAKALAEGLFGTTRLKFAGSLVPDRKSDELMAENFGLSRTYRGYVNFCPEIENYIVDFGFYLGLDCWVQGLYFRLHAPFVHTAWNLNASAHNISGEGVPFAPCFVSSDSAHSANCLQQALSGNFLFGNMKTRWESGKFDFCKRTRNGLADIDLILGYNFINDDCYHFGLYTQAVLPTGKRQKSEFVFDPVVGNGRHFELGAGISAHAVIWAGEDSNLALFLEGNITHMFKSEQCRLFDFKHNGPYSRYLLLKEFNTNGTTLTYDGQLISATNFNTRQVKVSLDVKGDFSLKLAYRWCGFGVDLGYNIYGHSSESIDRECEACPTGIDKRHFGIKETSGTCCFNFPIGVVDDVPTIFPNGAPFQGTVPEGCPDVGPIAKVTKNPNNETQNDATAFKPGKTPVETVPDKACSVCLTQENNVIAPVAVKDLTPENGFIVTNTLKPTLISVTDLNLNSAAALSVLTHKLFTHISYTWMDECGWNPQIGIGGEVEFDGKRHRNGHRREGLNQWGVWIKGCLSF